MKYQEIFLMNHIYVSHPNRTIPPRLCPRDEIAHPSKIVDTVFTLYKRWRPIKINDHMIHYKRIEYDHEFFDDVSSSHLYVLTDSPSLFKDVKNVRTDSAEDMFSYLQKYQSTLFLITTPIFIHRELQANVHYVMPVDAYQHPIFIQLGNTVEVRELLDMECYTICNGMTIFLAMLRSRVWNIRDARIAMERWSTRYNIGDIQTQDMDPIWQFLYMNHPVPMIAEFPMYYATMYPNVPETFYKYLKEEEDTVPLSQWIDGTNENQVKCFYASPITSMYPYFNRSTFDYYNPNFKDTDYPTTVLDTPFGLESEDSQQIDIEGFLIAMVRSRRAWRWWRRNGCTYLRKVWEVIGDSYTFSHQFLYTLFYLYEMPYKNIKYPRSRVRAIWNLVLSLYKISPIEIQMYIVTHLVKKRVYSTFNSSRIHPTIPLAFMLDLLKHCGKNINWFEVHKYKIYTSQDIPIVLGLFAPYIHMTNESIHEFSLRCSLYQLFKLDTEYNHIFIRHVIDKKIAIKLSYINQIFGMKEDQHNIVHLSENNAYIVGSLLKEYLYNNRNMII